MPESHALVATAHASRYLQQLCKHWAHKFAVEFTPSHGEIALPSGTVVLDATDEALEIRIRSLEDTMLDHLEGVVAEHILRFAFREELRFDWRRGSPA